MSSKLIGLAVLVSAAFIPSLVLAQTATTGILTVYVQVLNQSGFTYSPANFSVAVVGQNPSPAAFNGSQQGTVVSLNPGVFKVTVQNPYGFNVAYSQGCDNTIAAGATHSCVVTISAGNYAGYPNVYPYPHPYTLPALTCRTETPVVSLGQQARFVAEGGVGGTYNWATAYQNFPNTGPVLTTSFSASGAQSVTVTNAAQTATCAITVNPSYYPQPQNPTSPIYPGSSYIYPYQTQPTFTAYAYPRFPNTGFEPINAAQLAFATVLLMGVAIAAYPYARKAFATALR